MSPLSSTVQAEPMVDFHRAAALLKWDRNQRSKVLTDEVATSVVKTRKQTANPADLLMPII